jgi:peptide/nickel transport system permease protein
MMVSCEKSGKTWFGPWFHFVLGRIKSLLLVVGALLIITFMIIHLIPGDPARRIAGIDANAEVVEQLREELGLNRPLTEQFINYSINVLRFDFGNSYVSGEPVKRLIAQRFQKTALLAAYSLLLAMGFGILLGLLVGILTQEGRRKKLELFFIGSTSIAGSIPEFLAGTFLVFIFAVWLRWLPVSGANSPYSVILPVLAISIRPIALLARVVRLETLNVLAQDYIKVARSKRLPSRLLFLRHVLPNTLTAAITIGGVIFASLLGGTVIVENVFAWPGLGTAVVRAVIARDFPVIQGIVLILGLVVVIINLLVDVLVGVIDPRSLIKEG